MTRNDYLTGKHTAYRTFAAFLLACQDGYSPTLMHSSDELAESELTELASELESRWIRVYRGACAVAPDDGPPTERLLQPDHNYRLQNDRAIAAAAISLSDIGETFREMATRRLSVRNP